MKVIGTSIESIKEGEDRDSFKKLIEEILGVAMSSGADFAEVFAERTRNNVISNRPMRPFPSKNGCIVSNW